MPEYVLQLEAECENVLRVSRCAGVPYLIAFECGKCGEPTGFVEVIPESKTEIPNSRGVANLVCKCRQCNSANQVNVLQEIPYECQPGPQPFLKLEVRGSHRPVQWRAAKLVVETEGDTYDLEDELVEWDDSIGGNVSVLDVRYTVQ